MGQPSLTDAPVLVTGARGFIGGCLVAHLAGTRIGVRAFGRREPSASFLPDVEFVQGDLLDLVALRRAAAGCRAVIHLAGKTHDLADPSPLLEEYHRVNVAGTRNLLQAAVDAGAEVFCFVSSVKAMGEGGDPTLDEDAPEHPRTPYGITKLEAERLVASVAAATGMRWTVLRLPLVYGPGVRGNLGRMIAAIDRGRFPPPPRIANRRSLVGVEDVARACDLVVRDARSAGRTYLLTDGRDYSTREIYELISAALGRPPSRWAVPYAAFRVTAVLGDVMGRALGNAMPFDSDKLEKLLGSACYSSARIRRELGFVPGTTLPRALPGIVAAYRSGRT